MLIATKILPNFLIENSHYGTVAGIDEAGRGPLAGPVVAACIILDKNKYPKHLNDSKKLSKKQRENIYLELKNNSRFGIGIINEKIIDEVNIREATKLAMSASFEDLLKKYNILPDMVLVDGNFIPKINSSAKAIVKGDSKSLSIAAASIIAKVTRDEIMNGLHHEFPQYGWNKNQGYPTKLHVEKIKEFGISKYHRQSFEPIKTLLKKC